MMIGVSSSILVQMLEMGFIGQLSTAHVAAITFTFPLVMVLTSIALGISIGTSSVIARSVGTRQKSNQDAAAEGAGQTSADTGSTDDVALMGTHSLILVFGLMLLLSFLSWLAIDPLFIALGA